MKRLLAALVGLTLVAVRGACQPQATPLAQWQHTTWTSANAAAVQFGFGLQQSRDGYLWIGAKQGLIRFDGVRFTLIDSTVFPAFKDPTGSGFFPELVDRNGTMWVLGPRGMVISYRDGRFAVVVPGSTARGGSILMDGRGRLWLVGTHLRLFQNGQAVRATLPPGVPDSALYGVEPDNGTGLWIGTHHDGIWHVTGDSARRYGTGRRRVLLQGSDSAMWVIVDEQRPQLLRIANGMTTEIRDPVTGQHSSTRTAIEGPDGSVWMPTNSGGVLRWRAGLVERFSAREGLSDDHVRSILVSHEGPVWVLTESGLDRLRPSPFATMRSLAPSVPAHVSSFRFDAAGGLWTVDEAETAVHHHEGWPVTVRAGPLRTTRRIPPGPASRYRVLATSIGGGVWLRDWSGALIRMRRDDSQRFGAESRLPSVPISDIVESQSGTIWVRHLFSAGFGRIRNGQYHRITMPPGIGVRAYWEDAHARLWIAARDEPWLFVLEGDTIAQRIALPGAHPSSVTSFTPENADTLWLISIGELYRVANGRVDAVRIPAIADIFAGYAFGAVARDQLWLASAVGIARIPLAQLHAAADGRSDAITAIRLDALDGFITPRARSGNSMLQVSPDGRAWIDTPLGLVAEMSASAGRNNVAPRAIIEEFVVGNAPVALGGAITIPPRAARIAFRFTAPSLGLPERMRLEYRLDGADTDWNVSTPPRVATYGPLGAGTYRFRVRAWNEDGVPSAQEASLEFRVLAPWYLRWWFITLLTFAALGATTGAALLIQRERSRRVAARMATRFEAVIEERERLARELHDTLLQGFTGITLKIDGVRNRLEEQANPIADDLSRVLQVADRSLREARDMVWEIREPVALDADVVQRMEKAHGALTNADGADIHHVVAGTPRLLPPTTTAALLRISREATSNALRHAQARRIVVQLTYEPRRVTLEVHDDGRGADPELLAQARQSGHWGVAGMRERARVAEGTFSLTTAPGEGMRIVVTLPAPAP